MSDSPALPLWKRALLLAAPLLATLALLEGCAAIFGYARGPGDPFVGFSGRSPLYVPAPAIGDEVLETADARRHLIHGVRFTRTKQSGQYRVFALGGSTTYGRPYDADQVSFPGWLRVLLPAVDGSRPWEVINAGGISYASYRVAQVMEELVAYEPDLFIVYTGHNEFLERRTYSGLLAAPPWALRGVAALRSTRTWTMLADWLLPTPDSALLAEDPQAILDGSVGPDAYERDDRWAAEVRGHLRFNLERMVDLAEDAGARILFVTPASNLADFSPFRSQPGDGLAQADAARIAAQHEAARRAEAAGDIERAIAALEGAVSLDPRDAGLRRHHGRLLLAAGQEEQARDAFLAARDEDVCPLRAPTAVVDTVRAVAHERGVPLVDFEARIGALSDSGIPGDESFLDHVHPNAEVYGTLAEWLIDALAAEGIVSHTQDWKAPRFAALREQNLARIDRVAEAAALRNLAKVLGWAGMVDEVAALLSRALERNPEDVEALITLSSLHQAEGDTAAAVDALSRARAARPEDTKVRDFLADALLQDGQVARAIAEYRALLGLEPRSAWTHNNLAWVLATAEPTALRDPTAAARHAKRALVLAGAPNPLMLDTLAAAHASLGDTRAALDAVDRAIALARSAGDEATLASLARSRALYAAGRLPPMVE